MEASELERQRLKDEIQRMQEQLHNVSLVSRSSFDHDTSSQGESVGLPTTPTWTSSPHDGAFQTTPPSDDTRRRRLPSDEDVSSLTLCVRALREQQHNEMESWLQTLHDPPSSDQLKSLADMQSRYKEQLATFFLQLSKTRKGAGSLGSEWRDWWEKLQVSQEQQLQRLHVLQEELKAHGNSWCDHRDLHLDQLRQ